MYYSSFFLPNAISLSDILQNIQTKPQTDVFLLLHHSSM